MEIEFRNLINTAVDPKGHECARADDGRTWHSAWPILNWVAVKELKYYNGGTILILRV